MEAHTVVLIKTALQVVYFVALAGCTATALLNWTKLLGDSFSGTREDVSPVDEASDRRPGPHHEL